MGCTSSNKSKISTELTSKRLYSHFSLLFDQVRIMFCLQKLCFSKKILGIQKKVKKNNLALLNFYSFYVLFRNSRMACGEFYLSSDFKINVSYLCQGFLRDCPNGKLSKKQLIDVYQHFYPQGNVKPFCKYAINYGLNRPLIISSFLDIYSLLSIEIMMAKSILRNISC